MNFNDQATMKENESISHHFHIMLPNAFKLQMSKKINGQPLESWVNQGTVKYNAALLLNPLLISYLYLYNLSIDLFYITGWYRFFGTSNFIYIYFTFYHHIDSIRLVDHLNELSACGV